MMPNLSSSQAYAAMYRFLEAYYLRTGADDIGVLLGELSTLPNGSTADPAATSDWRAAVETVLAGEADTAMRIEPMSKSLTKSK